MWNKDGRIGLIAGSGELPVLFAQAARSVGKSVVVFDVDRSVDARLNELADEIHPFGMGDLRLLESLLRKSGVKKVALAGKVSKKGYYEGTLRMDDEAQKIVKKTRNKGDDHLLRAFHLFLKVKCGVSVMDTRVVLKDATAPRGVLSKRKPSPEEEADIRLGWKIAKGVGKMDIGQTVVVKRGIVLAVEAFEGTDEAIRRGAALGKGDAVVVKVAKPNQSLRFDLPCVGRETVLAMKRCGCSVLAVEAGKTLLISKQDVIGMADRENMVLVGL